MKSDALNIQVPKTTQIAVVGDIHEHEYQFEKMLDEVQPSNDMWLVSVGDIYDKGAGRKTAEKITDKFRELQEKGHAFVVQGNHEKKNIKNFQKHNRLSDQLEWLNEQPLVLSFVFDNTTRLTVMHGGVKPSHKWSDLNVDIETCYIRNLDDRGEMIKLKWVPIKGSTTNEKELRPAKEEGRSWHTIYDGRFGYIAAGHEPLKDGKPRYFNYSCNVDTACYCTGILTSQVFNSKGRGNLISVTGPALGAK